MTAIRVRVLVSTSVVLLSCGSAALANPGLFAQRPFSFVPDEVALVDMAVADFSGDGAADVYLALGNISDTGGGQVAAADQLYLNQEMGFIPHATPPEGAAPNAGAGVVAADFDGDGRIDAVVAGGATNGVAAPTTILRGAAPPAALLSPAGTVGQPVPSTGIAAVDFDADGDADLAIARASGMLDLFRNESSAGAFVFSAAGSLDVGGTALGRVAAGRFDAGAADDLVVLRPTGDADGGSGLTLYLNGDGGAPYFNGVRSGVVGPRALAVGDIDADGRDDVAVAGAPTSIAGGPASRVFFATAGGLAPDPFRFPAVTHTAVALAQLDGVAGLDIAFGLERCLPLPFVSCAGREASSLSIWLRDAAAWRHNAQCVGRHGNAPLTVIATRVNFDPLPDLVVAAVRGSDEDGTSWWSNNAGPTTALCCFAQTAAEYGEPESPGAVQALRGTAAVAAVDLDAYAGVRDEIMTDAINGANLRDRYDTFSPELVDLLRADLTLWSDAAAVLGTWSGPVRALVDGDGASATVSAPMIEAVDAFLVRVSGLGSPALVQAIAEERAALPPFGDLIGLDMDEFRAVVLPSDRVFRDDFE